MFLATAFLAPAFLAGAFFAAAFLAGTFSPAWRASDNPIAMACLRLVTFLPEPPLLSVPCLSSLHHTFDLVARFPARRCHTEFSLF